MVQKDDIEDKKDKTGQGLLAAFPTVESLNDFKEDFPKAGKSILIYAKDNGLDLLNMDELEAFIRENPVAVDVGPLHHKTFEEIIDHLRGERSINALIDDFNLVAKNVFGLKDISAVQIGRLKKRFHDSTVERRAVLRVISYWIGEHRSDYFWTYAQFEKMADRQKSRPRVERESGCILAIDIQSRGSLISADAVQWLEETIRDALNHLGLQKDYLRDRHEPKNMIKFPKKPGPAHLPILYNESIRNAMLLSHQIASRWMFAPVSENRNLIIAVHTGLFAEAPLKIKALLEFPQPDDFSIRLTDFSYLCVRTANLKVGLNEPENPPSQLPGNKVYCVDHFWFIYYDVIPVLLKEDYLPVKTDHYRQALAMIQGIQIPASNGPKYPFKALALIQNRAFNSMALIEIAKVLSMRRLYGLSDYFLAQIFVYKRDHIVARTIRMITLGNRASVQKDAELSELFYQNAISEGMYVMHHCVNEYNEEFLVEFALVYFSRAMNRLRRIRASSLQPSEKNSDAIKKDFQEALKLLQYGTTLSGKGDNRCNYWLLYTQTLLKCVEVYKGQIYKKEPFKDIKAVFRDVALRFFVLMGWIERIDFDEAKTGEFTDEEASNIIDQLLLLINDYANSVRSKGYSIGIKYAFACLLFDFAFKLNLKALAHIKYWLNSAKNEAEQYKEKQIGIYTTTFYFSQFQSADKFKDCVDTLLETIDRCLAGEKLPEDLNEYLHEEGTPFLTKTTMNEIDQVKLMMVTLDLPAEDELLLK